MIQLLKPKRTPLFIGTTLICFILLVIGTALFTISAKNVAALTGSDFNPGKIIDDSVFYNGVTLTVGQVQNFLDSKVPVCDTNGTMPASDWGRSDITHAQLASYIRNGTNGYKKNTNYHAPPYTCLKNYKQNIPQMEAASGLCDGIAAKSNRTAAQIITDVGAACGINPKVLIVLLEKEQSLITDNWPLQRQYSSATGFDCPDTAPCDPSFAGFFYQVYHAARQFKVYRANQNDYNYIAGRTNKIYWQTNLGEYINPTGNENDLSKKGATCGYSKVYIENQATAALYIYTPYRPNQKALANLNGTGDGCSAYGNRNFWRIFTQWFGSTTGVGIYSILYDTSTDTTGETGKIGYGLTKKPTSPVVISLGTSSKSNAVITSSGVVTILPENWNKPEKNTVTVKGLNNTNLRDVTSYQIIPTAKIESNDTRYQNFPRDLVGEATLVHQRTDTNKSVYRLYSPALLSHLFTSSSLTRDQLISNGWRSEGIAFQYCSAGEKTIYSYRNNKDQRLIAQNYQKQLDLVAANYSVEGPIFTLSSFGTKPVYWRYDTTNKRSLYTSSSTEGLSSGFTDMGIIGYSCTNDQRPVYRLYKPGGSHLYTTSVSERKKAQLQLGYRYERLAFYACTEGSPIYRLQKPSSGIRFYTMSQAEKNKAETLGYTYEGVAFNTCPNGRTDVYRLYEMKTGRRLYTTSASERDSAIKNGFNYEGVAFTTS